MTNKRPLIFLYPLSVSNKKYFDFLSAIDEEEREFELYEVDMLAEAAQLIASVGPSIMLSSNVKKCAKVLQENKVQLKKNSSKVILINEKEVPNNVYRKLQKMGLTDLLQEPVAQKTLEYKINILSNSLPKVQGFNEIVEEETEEEVVVFKKEKREEIKTEAKQRVEKGIITEKDTAPEPEVSKNSTDLSLFATSEEKDNKVLTDSDLSLFEKEETSEEEVETNNNISSYIKTVSTHDDLNIDFEKDSKDLEQESNTNSEENEEVEEKKESNEVQIESNKPAKDDDIEKEEEAATNEVIESNIDISLDFEKEDKEASNSNIEEDTDTPEKKDELDEVNLEKGTKEKSSEQLTKEEDQSNLVQDNEININLQSGDSSQQASDDQRTEEESKENKEDGFELESVDSAPSADKTSNELELDKKKKESEQSEISDSEDQVVSSESDTNIVSSAQDESTADSPNEPNIEDADTKEQEILDLKSSKEKSLSNEEKSDDNQFELQENNGEEIKLENADSGAESDNKKTDEELKLKKLDKNEVEIGDADSEVKKLDNALNEENELNNVDLNLLDAQENENDVSKLDIDAQNTDDQKEIVASTSKKLNIKNQADLVLAEAEKKKKKEQEIEYAEWGIGSKKQGQERYDDWVSKRKILDEVSFDVEKRGEVEIDYGDLYKQYKDVTIEQIQASEAGAGGVSGKKAEEDEIEDSKVIEPDSRGVEHVIKALMMYYNKAEEKQIFNYIANLVYTEFKGQVAFFEDNKEEEATEIYSAAHNIIYSGNRDDLINEWEEYKNANRFEWSTATLPTWSDTKYINYENNFVYPFFEGITKLGYANIYFPQNIKQDDASKLEMIVESARAIFLEHVKEEPKNTLSTKKEETTDDTKEKSKKGFFGKLFGK